MRLRIALTVDLNRNRPDNPEEPIRPDTEALVERAGNDEPNEMHIGFRAMPTEDLRSTA